MYIYSPLVGLKEPESDVFDKSSSLIFEVILFLYRLQSLGEELKVKDSLIMSVNY